VRYDDVIFLAVEDVDAAHEQAIRLHGGGCVTTLADRSRRPRSSAETRSTPGDGLADWGVEVEPTMSRADGQAGNLSFFGLLHRSSPSACAAGACELGGSCFGPRDFPRATADAGAWMVRLQEGSSCLSIDYSRSLGWRSRATKARAQEGVRRSGGGAV
jgi:hypothetical protein